MGMEREGRIKMGSDLVCRMQQQANGTKGFFALAPALVIRLAWPWRKKGGITMVSIVMRCSARELFVHVVLENELKGVVKVRAFGKSSPQQVETPVRNVYEGIDVMLLRGVEGESGVEGAPCRMSADDVGNSGS